MAAYFEASVGITDGGGVGVVKAVFGAASALIVEDIEFLVQECIKLDLSILHAPNETLDRLLVHVVNHLPLLWDLKELPGRFMLFKFLPAEVSL